MPHRSAADRHPSASAPTPFRRDPAVLIGVAVAVCVMAVTAAVVVWRSDMNHTDLVVLAAYSAVVAMLAAVVAARASRHRSVLRTSAAKAMALALEREERLRVIVSSLHDGLIFQDRDLRIVEFNDAATRILGLTETSLGRRPRDIANWKPVLEDGTVISFDHHPATVTLRTGEPTIDMVLGAALENGHTIWVVLNTVPVFAEDGQPDGVIMTFRDITAEKNVRSALASSEAAASVATEALSWQAFHDPLTELPNRAQLLDRLSTALERAKHTGTLTAVLSLDLDRFQTVNDTMGHEAGDMVLVEVSQRLRDAIPTMALVARLGGDEFTVVAEMLADRSEATYLADRLRACVARPLALPAGTVTMSASVGIAFDVDHRPSTLLRDADTALHKAKEHGGDRHEVFADSLRAEAVRKAAAEQMLRQALDEDGLRVLYQPIFDLRSGTTVSAEALLRVLGPHGEMLTPASFISIAEETGLIVPIGAGVLDEACRQLTVWRKTLGDRAPSSVSVNLSARQITTRVLPALVERTLARHNLAPAALTLELTETTLIEAGRDALDTVEQLHDMGVQLAIDDFGTGYSSLAYLKRFPVDTLKIDRSFTNGLGAEKHDTAIVRAVLTMGQSLGLTILAEGVETPDQLELLCELGCDEAQGFLLSRPVPGNELGPAIDQIEARFGTMAPRSGRVLRLAGGAPPPAGQSVRQARSGGR